MHPKEANKASERDGRHILCEAAENFGFVKFGENEFKGQPHYSPQIPEQRMC